MKKLKHTSKIILFIFIFLLQTSSFVSAEVTRWKFYENMTTRSGERPGFSSFEECQVGRQAFKDNTARSIGSNPSACTSYTVSGLPVPAAQPNDPPVNVNATTPVDLDDDIYTFLAPIGTEKTVKTTNIGNYINTIIKTIIGISAALAVIMIILAGIQMMGDESVFNKVEAKSKITGAILGLVIAVGAYALLNTINPDLLGKNGLSISGIDMELETDPLVSNDTFRPGVITTTCPEGIVYAQTEGGQIPVCKSREAKTIEMIASAKANGINLSGYGYRSTQRQRELRAQNCGGVSQVDNHNAKCKPPTAVPGYSRHENGLAIDFQCDRVQIRSTDNKCFKWLKANGRAYGYENLPSEPWHWSSDGH